MSLDRFFGRAYDGRDYNCAHLAIEAWEHLTGRKVAASVAGFLVPGIAPAALGHADAVTALRRPQDPCFVLMRSAKREWHLGLFHGGKIMHFASGRTVQFQPPEVVTFGYSKIRYFTC